MINLNLSAIRTNKDRVGIMCHTPEQLGKVCDILGYKFEQSKFETVILSTQMFATVHPTANGYIFVQAPDFIAANPPLFTSEDGVPMYPDSLCWLWNEVTQQYGNHHGKPTNQLGKHTYDGSTPSWKLFSTKEARDGYACKNKVYLTTNDGVKIKLGDTYWFVHKESGGINRGVESGIITHTNDCVYFSTYEKAKEYQEKNNFRLITHDGVTITNPEQTIYVITANGEMVNIYAKNHKMWPNGLFFSTIEARVEHMVHLTPKYSDADLEKYFNNKFDPSISKKYLFKEFKMIVGK